ncbi:unnamed protein product, partial [Thlaspi arvense]
KTLHERGAVRPLTGKEDSLNPLHLILSRHHFNGGIRKDRRPASEIHRPDKLTRLIFLRSTPWRCLQTLCWRIIVLHYRARIVRGIFTMWPTQIVMDRVSDRSKGFGFVTFASDDEARKALMEFNGQQLNGRVIFVNYAKRSQILVVVVAYQ